MLVVTTPDGEKREGGNFRAARAAPRATVASATPARGLAWAVPHPQSTDRARGDHEGQDRRQRDLIPPDSGPGDGTPHEGKPDGDRRRDDAHDRDDLQRFHPVSLRPPTSPRRMGTLRLDGQTDTEPP